MFHILGKNLLISEFSGVVLEVPSVDSMGIRSRKELWWVELKNLNGTITMELGDFQRVLMEPSLWNLVIRVRKS